MAPLWVCWLFVALVAVAPAWLVLRSYWTRSYNLTQWCFWALALCLTKLQWRATMPRQMPHVEGGAVVICNHRSSIDPFLIQVLRDRMMHWMVAKEFLPHPIFGWFLRSCKVIPVGRSGVDNAATKQAIALACKGGWIGMFPEGRVNQTDQLLLPSRPGAVLVALKARVPVIPCYIQGSPFAGTPWSPLLMTARARLVVGDPIDLSPYYGCERDAAKVRELLVRCLKQVAKLAGDEQFEPEVAGRKWRPREAAPMPDQAQ